jgi:hypothetical protein
LLVDLADGVCRVRSLRVGTWHFVRHRLEVGGLGAAAAVHQWLEALPAKRRTLVRLGLHGTLSLRADSELRAALLQAGDVFARVELWERHTDLAELPHEPDRWELGLSGFAGEAVERLSAKATRIDDAGIPARESLALLYRLVSSAA